LNRSDPDGLLRPAGRCAIWLATRAGEAKRGRNSGSEQGRIRRAVAFTLADAVLPDTTFVISDPGADWNSPYWRRLGSPWGGVHASAPDVARFLAEFLHQQGKVVRPETARLMIRNHNPDGLTSRGLGFSVGARAGSPGCSEATFGHTGSTGTLAWADPRTETICVVLTTLPARAGRPHPRSLVSDRVAEATA
jgi:CubicO group peptidase (beta-lactamase class C family)